MKKNLLFLLACCLVGSLTAQTGEKPIVVSPIYKHSVRTLQPNQIPSAQFGKSSTTVVQIDSMVIKDCEVITGRDYLVDLVPAPVAYAESFGSTVPVGYIAGTGAPVSGSNRFESFGMMFTLNNTSFFCDWRNALGDATNPVQVTEIIMPNVGSSPEDRLYFSRIVGTPDNFEIRFNNKSIFTAGASTVAPCVGESHAPAFPPFATREFTIEDLEDEFRPHTLVLNPPVTITQDSFFIFIQVDKFGNNDTLAPALVDATLFNADLPFACGGNFNSWITLFSKDSQGQTVPSAQRLVTIARGLNCDNDGMPVSCCPSDFNWTNVTFHPVFETASSNVSGCGTWVSRPAISQNNMSFYAPYPNPATNRLNIRYELMKTTHMQVRIFDQLQRTVDMLDLGQQAAGAYVYEINTANYAAGTYYVQAIQNGQALTQKFTVVK